MKEKEREKAVRKREIISFFYTLYCNPSIYVVFGSKKKSRIKFHSAHIAKLYVFNKEPKKL